jgi:hypothetical protein
MWAVDRPWLGRAMVRRSRKGEAKEVVKVEHSAVVSTVNPSINVVVNL